MHACDCPRPRLLSFAALVVLSGALFLACGGSSNGGTATGLLLDPKSADALTHAGLLSALDLPGSGWRIIENDRFTSALDTVDAPACDDLKSLREDATKGLAGRAERGLEQPSVKTLTGVVVSDEVRAYKKRGDLPALMDRYRGQVTDGSFVNCFRVAVTASLSYRLNSVTPSPPSTQAPHGGVALALDYEFEGQSGLALTRRLESYDWTMSNVVVAVDLDAPKDLLTPELVIAVLQKTQAAIDRATKGK
jgi:hypothetical protein